MRSALVDDFSHRSDGRTVVALSSLWILDGGIGNTRLYVCSPFFHLTCRYCTCLRLGRGCVRYSTVQYVGGARLSYRTPPDQAQIETCVVFHHLPKKSEVTKVLFVVITHPQQPSSRSSPIANQGSVWDRGILHHHPSPSMVVVQCTSYNSNNNNNNNNATTAVWTPAPNPGAGESPQAAYNHY